MTENRGKIAALLMLLLAVTAVAVGCGSKEEEVKEADSEGLSVDVGEFSYQVQISRQLNPADAEDVAYLEGLPAGTSTKLPPEKTWFGIFMRARNNSDDKTLRTADEFTIVDSEGIEYSPIPLSDSNKFAYRPAEIGPENVFPSPESIAGLGPTNGLLLLYKIDYSSFSNRPLKLKIADSSDPEDEAEVVLDL